MSFTTNEGTSWVQLLKDYVAKQRLAAFGLASALLIVALLIYASLTNPSENISSAGLRLALFGAGVVFLTNALGALPALFLSSIGERLQDSLLGFSAGMMLSASAFSLLLPGLDAAESLTGNSFQGAIIVVLGMALGVILMLGLDVFTPHEHEKSGPCGPGHQVCGRIWLFVFAIALHNLPEGMAIGIGFAGGDIAVGLPLTSAIALQDIPEGLAVALALRGIVSRPIYAVLIATATGFLEPVGVVLGLALAGGGLAYSYPLGLGLAAGAMIFVVSHEVIPETHRNGHQTPATIGLMIGFALMMIMDTAIS